MILRQMLTRRVLGSSSSQSCFYFSPILHHRRLPEKSVRKKCLCAAALLSASASKATFQTLERNAGSVTEKASRQGSLRVIIGPMFAGKTSELLRHIDSCESKGIQTMVVKSAKDTRYNKLQLSTHTGQTRECFAVAKLFDLQEHFGAIYRKAEVIIVDEAQFFPDLHDFCEMAVDDDHKTVIVAGLSGDFRRQKFGQIIDVIPMADKIEHLEAECRYCQSVGTSTPAIFTLRIAADDRQEVVGGADKYAPVCRKHYNLFSEIRNIKLKHGEGRSEEVVA